MRLVVSIYLVLSLGLGVMPRAEASAHARSTVHARGDRHAVVRTAPARTARVRVLLSPVVVPVTATVADPASRRVALLAAPLARGPVVRIAAPRSRAPPHAG